MEGEGVGKGREEKEKEEEEDVGGIIQFDVVDCAGTDLLLVPSLMQEEAPIPSESSPFNIGVTNIRSEVFEIMKSFQSNLSFTTKS